MFVGVVKSLVKAFRDTFSFVPFEKSIFHDFYNLITRQWLCGQEILGFSTVDITFGPPSRGQRYLWKLERLVDWSSLPLVPPISFRYNSTNNALDFFLLSDRNEV